MNKEQQNILLRVARDSVQGAICDVTGEPVKSDDPELNVHQGCFVTLKNSGRLRGCLGQFTSEKPLIELISEMATASASRDPRFMTDSITPGELSSLDIEISVLSAMKLTDDPMSLRLGVNGIYITNGPHSGCFLPQVATETDWDKEEFLSYCCGQKAGLAPDAWKEPQTQVYLFTADAFGAKFADI